MKLKQKLIVAIITAVTTASALAEIKDTLPETNTFSKIDIASLFEQDTQLLQLASLSVQEMKETEGAIAPLVYVGVMAGTRFIIQRAVTQRMAQSMVARGATNILAPNRAIARNIARRNSIREYHAGSGSRYTHYHPNPRNGSHIWYGKPR